MKIQTSAVISSITAKADKSLGLRVSTPELDNDARNAIMDIQNQNLTLTIEPSGENSKEIIEVKKEIGEKTPSERLRSVLYIYWDQKKRDDWKDFNSFYRYMMEKTIDNVKNYLVN